MIFINVEDKPGGEVTSYALVEAGRAVTRPMVPATGQLGCWGQRHFPEMCNYMGHGQPVGVKPAWVNLNTPIMSKRTRCKIMLPSEDHFH